MRADVREELIAAHERGEAWTPLRPFHDADEQVGAHRCCGKTGRCRKPAKYVSYCTGIDGRVAYCEDHAKPYLERAAR